jgi:hypothetical protein
LSGDERTKREALRVLLQLAEERRRTLDDVQLQRVLSDELVSALFDLAWKYQWERSAAGFIREARPLVDTAVDGAVSSVED